MRRGVCVVRVRLEPEGAGVVHAAEDQMLGQIERRHKMILVRVEEVPAECNQIDLVHELWTHGVLDAEAVHVDEVPADRDLVVAVPASNQHGDQPPGGVHIVIEPRPLAMTVHQDFVGPASTHPAPDQSLLVSR